MTYPLPNNPFGPHRDDPHFFPPKPSEPMSMSEFMRSVIPPHVREQGRRVEAERLRYEKYRKFRAGLARRELASYFEWNDGQSRPTFGQLIKTINKNPNLYVTAHSSFKDEFAELQGQSITLPTGRHTIRALLDAICEQTNTNWSFDKLMTDWIVLQRRQPSAAQEKPMPALDRETLVELRGEEFAKRFDKMSAKEKHRLMAKISAERRGEAAEEDTEVDG